MSKFFDNVGKFLKRVIWFLFREGDSNFSIYFPGDCQNLIGQIPPFELICTNCKREIYRKDIIKCGPCGGIFCSFCWGQHQWVHGKAPGVGIEFHSNGSYSGYDGSERLK